MDLNSSVQERICAGAEKKHHTEPAVRAAEYKGLYPAVKRCLDVAIALILGIVLLIPMILIAVLIRLDSPGPAIFTHKRMGQNGKAFLIYKFRTMRTDAPDEMATRDFTDSDKYITRMGAFLRRTSIDELPQLLNILKGEMSFVGYRPVCLTEEELNQLRMEYGVFAVKPGITGLAQVSGRDHLGYEEKAELDARYTRECSFKLDVWCLFRTITTVISGEGVM